MIKDGRKLRLAMIKAIGERRKAERENNRLKNIIIKMACCGNCGNTENKPCGNCTHQYPDNPNCSNHWTLKK